MGGWNLADLKSADAWIASAYRLPTARNADFQREMPPIWGSPEVTKNVILPPEWGIGWGMCFSDLQAVMSPLIKVCAIFQPLVNFCISEVGHERFLLLVHILCRAQYIWFQ